MEASDTWHEAETPTASSLAFGEVSEALMRDSQTPTTEPNAPEPPACRAVEDHRPPETLQGESRGWDDSSVEIPSLFLEDGSVDGTPQESLKAKLGPANTQARIPSSPELWGLPDLGTNLERIPVPNELQVWGAGNREEPEEHPADNLAPPYSSGSLQGEYPAGTSRPQEVPRERRGPVECTHPQDDPGQERQRQQQVGVPGGQEPVEEWVSGQRGEQRQGPEQGKEAMRTETLGGPSHGQWDQEASGWRSPDLRPGDHGEEWAPLGAEENEVDIQPGPLAEQGLHGELSPVEEWGQGAGSGGEQEVGGGGGIGEQEDAGTGEGEAGESGPRGGQTVHNGPPTVVSTVTSIHHSCDLLPKAACPTTRDPGAQVELWTGDVSPLVSLTPDLEPGWSHLPVFPPSVLSPEASPDKEASQEVHPEGPAHAPPGTSSWVTDSPCSITSLPTSPGGETLPSEKTTEPSRLSPSKDHPVLWRDPKTPRASLTGSLPKNPLASSSGSPQHSPPASPLGSPPQGHLVNTSGSPQHRPPASPLRSPPQGLLVNTSGSPQHSPPNSPSGCPLHLRSNSFPGSQRTELSLDLVSRSLSFSQSEPPQRPPKPAIYGSVAPRRDRRSVRDSGATPEPPAASLAKWTGAMLPPSLPERSRSAHPGVSEHSSALNPHPPLVSVDGRAPELPSPLDKRWVPSSMGERDSSSRSMAPALQRHSHPPCKALRSAPHSPPTGPPDPLVARQLRPLPSTPDCPCPAPTSLPPRTRYNKPLPPTPSDPQPLPSPHSPSRSHRSYKPLPPVPTLDSAEPPPLPPKARARSQSMQAVLVDTPGQARPQLGEQDCVAPSAPSAGRTSWPLGSSQTTNPGVTTSREKSDMGSSLAFSNMTNFLSLSSPTTAWAPELGPWLAEDPAPIQGPSTRAGPQEGTSNPQGAEQDQTRPLERHSHAPLEKACSWPHRRDPGRPPPGSSGPPPVEGPSKSKGWNRQGLRRPSILPEGASEQSPAMESSPASSDTIIFREKKVKETAVGISRRCSKLISTQLLYQEYSDVFLNKEIQSQQRLDSLAESSGLASPRQPRKALGSTESYLHRLSSASSSSLWQEIPMVRNSKILHEMTRQDQKLQEAKFELIVSEASYLRSLNVAVDHFQLSSQLRITLSNQEHQWLFSRLQEVRDVSNTFLFDLEEKLESNIFAFHVCDVVLEHTPNFRRVYLPYVTNQTYQERTFQSLMINNSQFREVLERLESDPVCQRLSLKSFLILPFQRITRLKLLLQNILKRTQPSSQEEAEATKAHHALEELIRDCNSNVQRMRHTEELIYLSQKIEFECKIFPLISQSRWLVKSGELTALEVTMPPGLRRKLSTRPVHLHLFNDCLLLSRPREGSRFLVFDHAPFSEVRGEKCEMKLHGAHKNLFRLFLRQSSQRTQAEFLFSTETQSEKLRWISALSLPREELDLLECYDSPQVQCLRAYKPRENDELALEKADVVMVTQQSSDGWLEGVKLSDGERGWFPVKQVDFIKNPDVRARNLKEAQRVKTARLQLVEQGAQPSRI